jgi:hypothetical protein
MNNAEWLNRTEPARVHVEDFRFRLKVSKRELYGMHIKTHGGDCLANEIASPEKQISGGSTGYGEERIHEDGSAEKLVGCRVCRAVCTLNYDKDIASAVNNDEPYTLLNIAEAPQPNPWHLSGTFYYCKAGKVIVPAEVSVLIDPVVTDLPLHHSDDSPSI